MSHVLFLSTVVFIPLPFVVFATLSHRTIRARLYTFGIHTKHIRPPCNRTISVRSSYGLNQILRSPYEHHTDAVAFYFKKGTSRKRSGKGAIRKRFPLQKPRWEKTRLTIRHLYHETYRKPNEQLFSK